MRWKLAVAILVTSVAIGYWLRTVQGVTPWEVPFLWSIVALAFWGSTWVARH